MAARPGEGQATSAKPVEGQAAAVAKRERAGKIYISVNRRLIELDPITGARVDIFDSCSMRPRVAWDGKSVAFGRENALWVLDPKAESRKIVDLGSFSGEPAAWSPDGKQIIVNAARMEISRWVYTTLWVNTDGTGREKPAIPPKDCVQDWSADGRWLLTASARGAKAGWVLYVMRPDGTDQRRITEGGNPFYARFSPDGRRMVYTDNGRDELSGIWIVDVDGKKGRLVLPVETKPKAGAVTVGSAC
jgi:Tol biopolymer transport system component